MMKRRRSDYFYALVLTRAFVMVSAISVCAQEPVYRYSEADIENSINATVKSYAKKDLEKQARYKMVIQEGFNRYWSLPEAKASISPNTIAELDAKADSLSLVLASKGHPQVEIDSLANLLSEYQALTQTIKQQGQLLEDRRKEIQDLDKDIERLDSELADAKERQDKFSQAQDSLKAIGDNLLKLYARAQSKDDFSGFGIEETDTAINRYISARKSVETFNIGDVKALDNAVKGLETLSSLKLLVDDALGAMAAKYTPSRNNMLIEDIRIEAAKEGPTPGQKEFLTSILLALQNQSGAVDSFLSILASLPKDYYCVPDDDSRNSLGLDKYIIKRVQEFNNSVSSSSTSASSTSSSSSDSPTLNSLETYDPRYIQLNQVLQQLLDDLSPNSKMPIAKINTDDKFQSYLKEMGKKVK